MATRKLYRLTDGTFVRTLAEIPKDQEPNRVDVPVDSPELCQFLNQLLLGSGTDVTGMTDEQRDEVFFPARDVVLQKREQFEEAWDGFPLTLKCHFASLAMEDCRRQLK